MERFISEYSTSRGTVLDFLADNTIIQPSLFEFCSAFNLRIDAVSGGHVRLLTLSGLEAGVFSLQRDGNGSYYLFSSRLIRKEKASRRSARSERDASKITGLITALKKNKEAPVDAEIIKNFKSGIAYAVSAIATSGVRGGSFSMSTAEELAAAEFILGLRDEVSFNSIRESIRNKYDEYQKQISGKTDALRATQRYARGCTLIGVRMSEALDRAHYLVAKVDFDTTLNPDTPASYQLRYQTPLTRYQSLAQVEGLSTTVPILRTYFESLPGHRKTNELGVPHDDKYYPDIDVATGFHYNDYLWVLIPNEGE